MRLVRLVGAGRCPVWSVAPGPRSYVGWVPQATGATGVMGAAGPGAAAAPGRERAAGQARPLGLTPGNHRSPGPSFKGADPWNIEPVRTRTGPVRPGCMDAHGTPECRPAGLTRGSRALMPHRAGEARGYRGPTGPAEACTGLCRHVRIKDHSVARLTEQRHAAEQERDPHHAEQHRIAGRGRLLGLADDGEH